MQTGAGTFATAVLWISVLTWAAFGFWLLMSPTALAGVGIDVQNPTARAEIRAFYGGLELGVAVAILWLGRRRVADGLRVALTSVGCVAVARLGGMVFEGFAVEPMMWVFFGLEATAAVLTTLALRTTSGSELPEANTP